MDFVGREEIKIECAYCNRQFKRFGNMLRHLENNPQEWKEDWESFKKEHFKKWWEFWK